MKRYLSRELLLSLFLTFLVLALYLARTHPSGMLGAGEREKKESLATLVFAGDVMVHDSQIEAAYRPEDGSYSFYSCFEPLKEITARADLAVINLETVLAGEELGYTGYPAFNTPESLARALKEAGFDLVCTANNHSLDRGETGVLKTLEHLEAAGLKSFGTYSSREAREKPLLVETKGIKIAFLAYTYDTNGIPLPENKEYLVNMLDPELIIADIHRVRRRADLVVLYIHWGLEYHREPSRNSRNWPPSSSGRGPTSSWETIPTWSSPSNLSSFLTGESLRKGWSPTPWEMSPATRSSRTRTAEFSFSCG